MSTVVVNGAAGAQSVVVDQDLMEIMPLGSGQEVGRSCVVVKFKGSCVMFDCGIHPAHSGLQSFPFFDEIDPSTVDLLLITHFHMDHCGAVPYFTEKTNFKGRVFMTHPTKAIFKILQHDAVKVGHDEGRLFDEKDMLSSLPPVVVAILRRHPTCMAVAGGAVLAVGRAFRQHQHGVRWQPSGALARVIVACGVPALGFRT